MNNIKSFKQGQWKRFLKQNKGNILVLMLILCIGCFFIFIKQGYHTDEMLSFELANAEFTPWIVPTQPEGRLEKFVKNEIYAESFRETCMNIIAAAEDVLVNRGASKALSYKADVYEEPVWISAGQFRDYITTDGHDRFNYLSVYFNVKDDNHPPLHFMALHTISSLFPGRAAAWMGCIINLACVLGVCVFLMKICREFLENEELGWAVCILYACSMAGISTILLIRMYAMLTFFCMAALYLHMRKMQAGQWRRQNGRLIFVTVCGFLTQYYFVIFMLLLAGISIFYILKKYDRKDALYYSRTMGISAALGLFIFPFSVADVLYSGRGIESVQNLKGGFSGVGERFISFANIIKEKALGGTMGLGIFLITIVAAFTAWLLLKNAESSEMAEIKKKERAKEKKQNGSLAYLYRMAGVPLIGYFLMVVKIAPFYVDRYLMPVFPLLAFFIGVALSKCLEYLKGYLPFFGKGGVLTGLAVLMVLPNMKLDHAGYLYQGYSTQAYMSEVYADAPCVCVYDGLGYYENLIEFTNYKKTLLVTTEELLGRPPDPELEEEDRLVVLYKNGVDPEGEIAVYLEEKYGFRFSGFLVRGSVHGDNIVIYEKQEGI